MATRHQLSLFVLGASRAPIEQVRQRLDPVQHALIPAHVTLCREDELREVRTEEIATRVASAPLAGVTLRFGAPISFQGHGVLMPCIDGSHAVHTLRQHLLGTSDVRVIEPHLTLAHPRNPRAPGNDLAHTESLSGGCTVHVARIQLIEQVDDQPWTVLQIFELPQSFTRAHT